MKTYGEAPKVITNIELSPKEMMFYLYLPIKMAGGWKHRIPERLGYLDQLIDECIDDCEFHLSDDYIDRYVYITAKTLYVEQGSPGNRPGWHVDGYGSNGDINYIWANMNPTEFIIQDFKNIPDDDIESMNELTRQADIRNSKFYPDNTLLRLNESVVHRVNPVVNSGIRTFIKVSVSKNRYNLAGNSHNYLFDYDWELHDRAELRNVDNKDYH